MKFLISAFITLVTLSVFGQPIEKSINLHAAFTKIEKPYFFKAPNFTPWAESHNMLLIGDKPDPGDCDYLFLALQDTTLIGIFKTNKPNYFLLDTEGDSVLNTTSDFFFLPLWTVKRNTKIISSDKKIYFYSRQTV